MSMSEIKMPEGFNEFPLDGSFQDSIAPMYVRLTDQGVDFGLQVQKHHVNGLGIVHGAVITALLDIAMVASVCHALGDFKGTPTINLNINFLNAAKVGDWLQTRISSAELNKTMGFCEGVIDGPDGVIAHASGRFKLPKS